MSFFIGGVRVRLSFWFFFLVSLLLLVDRRRVAGLFLFAVAVHEGGHLLYLLLARLSLGEVDLSPRGLILSLAPGQLLSPGQSLLLNLSGCGANFLAAAVLALLSGKSAALLRLSAVNTALGLANLLPVPGLDGGQALEDTLTLLLGWRRGLRLHALLTRALCLVGAAACGWMLCFHRAGGAAAWLFLILAIGGIKNQR